MYVSLYRLDGVTHCVLADKPNPSNPTHALCIQRLDGAYRLAPYGMWDDSLHEITCPKCLSSFTGFSDLMHQQGGEGNNHLLAQWRQASSLIHSYFNEVDTDPPIDPNHGPYERDISPYGLVATQYKLKAKKVQKFTAKPSRKPVEVVLADGKWYVIDGHHRISAAQDRNVIAIRAMVWVKGIEKQASTWRGFTPGDELIWQKHDVVILTDRGGGGRRKFECYVAGQAWRNFDRLDEAKAAVENEYGPVDWVTERIDPVIVGHYYYGPLDLTSPTTIHWADY